MSILRALIAKTLAPTKAEALAALLNPAPEGFAGVPSYYLDSAIRSTMRALMDAAGNSGSDVKLAFYKTGGDLRYMLARPVVGADQTNQYYTVQDLELSETRGNPVYRRVNLDAVVGAQVEYRAAA